MKYTEEQIYKYGIRDIVGYEGRYAITSCGKVWSYRSGRFLTPKLDKDGYLQVGLYDKSGKQHWRFVSRLVGLTYLDNPDNLPEVAHKNEEKFPNSIPNLEWASKAKNCNMPLHKQRISENKCRKYLCVEENIIFNSRKEAAAWANTDASHITRCCNGERETAGKYHWQRIS